MLTYNEDREEYTFSSGRVGRANRGIIGIAPDLEVTDGYDGGFDTTPPRRSWAFDGDDDLQFTPAERAELANYMIERWTAFKNKC
jgi:hypothetical protein